MGKLIKLYSWIENFQSHAKKKKILTIPLISWICVCVCVCNVCVPYTNKQVSVDQWLPTDGLVSNDRTILLHNLLYAYILKSTK